MTCAACGGAPAENVTAKPAEATPVTAAQPVAPAAAPPVAKVKVEPLPMISDAELEALPGAEGMPRDIQRYVAQRGDCEHWTGEEPYDAARKAEIEANVAESCTGLDARLESLRKRHAGDPATRAFLGGFDTIGM
ncbi:MAG: hypothetical protein EOP60_08820 [Sphingomonadales bacterium]|nr:MAG: hypothetical protein EOP60_08820 [Sphingomonadales bacterium]